MGKNVKKTIVYIGKFIPPNGNAVAQRVYSNAKLLKTLGYKVILIGCKRDITELQKCEDEIFETYALPYPAGVRAWVKYCVSAEDYLNIIDSKEQDEIGLVITTNHPPVAQRSMRKALKKRKIAYADDLTEWIRKTKEHSKVRLIKDVSTFVRMHIESIKTDNLICISKYLYDHFKGKGCAVTRIPGLIDYDEEKWQVCKDYSPNKIRTVVYAGDAGSIGYKERLDRVVAEACKLYDEGRPLFIEMIGVDREAFVNQCSKIAHHPAFDKVAVFHGRQSHEFCLEKIAKADASVLVRENSLEMQAGFPTKLSESLRLGTPPLVTMIGDYNTFITPGVDSIVLSDTSNEEVRKSLLRLYDMSDGELMDMHIACKNNRSFDYRNFEDEMKNFVERAIESVK